MVLAFAAVIASAAAGWVPARWPSGDAATLDLLAGTPVNCVLVEAEHWDASFVRAARGRRVAVLGVVRRDADVARAKGFGFDGVVVEGRIASAREAAPLVIELPNRAEMRFDTRAPVVGTVQGLWPGVEAQHGGTTVLGPTSTPWVYTNGGFLRFARAATDAMVWIGVRPPPRTIYPVERYAQAIGDAALVGARWIVALDDDLSPRLLKRDPAAIRDWRRIGEFLNYWERHGDWKDYRAYSQMAVIQGAASGGLLSGSLLDMLASQRSSVLVVPPDRVRGEWLKDARVVLDVDPESLTAEQRSAIDEFVKRGGVLIRPPAKWRFPQVADDQVMLNRRQADQLQSLWEVTYNATVRKNFGVRIFNSTGILSSVVASRDGRSMLVHMQNFLDFAGESMTVHVLGKWTRARLYRFGERERELPVFDVPGGTGVEIDRLALMGTIRFE